MTLLKKLTAFHKKRSNRLRFAEPFDKISRLRDVKRGYLWQERKQYQRKRKRRKRSVTRNYGFIEKVADLAETNTQYAQFFDPNDLRNAIMNFDLCRELILLLRGFVRAVSDTMLTYSDEALNMSLIFYNIIKEMSRRGDPVANAFHILSVMYKMPHFLGVMVRYAIAIPIKKF